jgi:nucleotide-binding universal stress UspA family protein
MAPARKKTKRKSKTVSRQRKTGTTWIMAIDPFGGVDLEPMWQLVKPLSERFHAQVQAAFVLAPSGLNWTGDFSGKWMKRYLPIAQEKLAAILPDKNLPKEVIPCHKSGQGAAAKMLIQHATKLKADCLIISTHGRTGLERIAMGSFAETVILTSKIPVLVINPAHKVPHRVRKILVPTDLSQKSEKFIASVADYAKNINAEIVLFHKQPDPLDPLIQQGVYSLGGGWVSMQSYIDDELVQKNKRVEKLEGMLRKRHIGVSHVFDSSPEGLIESIERAAKENDADMVSVLTQTGSWGAALLGSVARGLVRNSSLPVLVRR